MSQTTYAVMGLDKSGLAAVRYLVQKGCRVLAWDDNPAQLDRARAAGAEITHLAEGSYDCDLILTPGIALQHPIAQRFKNIIGDVELFARDNPDARIIGITGTNGKSTTTALIQHILTQAGRNAAMGGNFGTSPLALPAADIYVLELSSYQLERCPSLKVEVGVMLNLTPDHLDRHGDMDGYATAKANLFRNGTGTVIYGTGDSWTQSIGEAAAARGWKPAAIDIPANGQVAGFDLGQLKTLPGAHNWQNALAAMHACRAVGLADDAIFKGLATFPGLAHRQQLFAVQNSLSFVNDSKATNADATAKALGCYETIYWILGGRAKSGGLDGLEGYMPRIRKAFVIGEAAEAFGIWLEANKVAYEQCGDLKTATSKAYQAALDDESNSKVILLSPACASLDQFKGYEERGTLFMNFVHDLLKEKCA